MFLIFLMVSPPHSTVNSTIPCTKCCSPSIENKSKCSFISTRSTPYVPAQIAIPNFVTDQLFSFYFHFDFRALAQRTRVFGEQKLKRCEITGGKAVFTVGGTLRQPVHMDPHKPWVEVILSTRVTAVPLCCLMMETDWSGWVSQASVAVLTHDGPPGSCCADGWLGKTFCGILYFCGRRRWPMCDPHNKVSFFLAFFLSSFCFLKDTQVAPAFKRGIICVLIYKNAWYFAPKHVLKCFT